MVVTCGNTCTLKPSEKDPGAAMLQPDHATEAGLPPGLLNIVHATHKIVHDVCDHPDTRAISFVGSDVLACTSTLEPQPKAREFSATWGLRIMLR